MVRSFRAAFGAALVMVMLAGCERTQIVQRGYRGQGMMQLYSPSTVDKLVALNKVPVALRKASPAGPTAAEQFQNVQLLGDLSKGEFARLMLSFQKWVAPPDQGCNFCHNAPDYASDAKYPKLVARAMIAMTRHINSDWKTHVKETGVTCYTCHRGQPVPPMIWFKDPGPKTARGMLGNRAGQNMPGAMVGVSALPYDPLTSFLQQDDDLRVMPGQALPDSERSKRVPFKQAEATYALMMNISQSLGVNCTYCHNSQQFAAWELSPPARETAWYGIRMVRDLNNSYVGPLSALLPATRLGPSGDGPKLYCATCHLGSFKPLNGAVMIKDFPELVGPKTHVSAPAPKLAVAAARLAAKP